MIAKNKREAFAIIDKFVFNEPIFIYQRSQRKRYYINAEKFDIFMQREKSTAIAENIDVATSRVFAWRRFGFITEDVHKKLSKFYDPSEFIEYTK